MIKFSATIRRLEWMDAAFIEFPYNVEELFNKKGQVKVKALFDGKVEYRGSLAKMGLPCHFLGITKEIRKKLGKSFGDVIDVELEEDFEVREVIIPEDVALVLSQNPDAAEFFNSLSYTFRKEYIRWIETAKKEETRKKRLELLREKLLGKKKPEDK